VDGYFVVTGRYLTVPSELRARVLDSPDLLLRLFEMARSRRLKIDTDLLDEIHSHMGSMPNEAFRTPEVNRVFLKILAGPGAVAGTLGAMHRAHLLEKLIPDFATVHGLMQFNEYHKYTVDEHTLLAVAKAEALDQEPGVIGKVCQEIRRKDLLHLAILLHDLGKGRKEDHSEVGKRIAEEMADLAGMDSTGRPIRLPTSIHGLSPRSRFLAALDRTPLSAPSHSIIGSRDGIVPQSKFPRT
jgi:[protein-PII] uridylyltransferase